MYSILVALCGVTALSLVQCIPKLCKYNCDVMEAQLFPTSKTIVQYGQKSFQLRGVAYQKVLTNLDKYRAKVFNAQKAIRQTFPPDQHALFEQYMAFRKTLFDRDQVEGFTEKDEDLFQDKLKLQEYADILAGTVSVSYEFLNLEGPVDWVDKDHLLYFNLLTLGLNMNYVAANREYREKSLDRTDYCQKLSSSLHTDGGWSRGLAKDAFDLVYNCYDSFPYNLEAANRTYDLALLMVDFYVFSNFTSNGLGASTFFRALKEQQLQFDSHFRFSQFMTTTLNNLNDAHITLKTDCYDQFTYIQPLFMQYMKAGDAFTGELYITKVNTPELQEYVDSLVVAIDGRDTFHKVFGLANSLGKSHNGNNRFGLGFSKLYFDSAAKDFRLDRAFFLKRTTIPGRSYLVYTLKKPGSDAVQEIRLDWMIFKNPTLVDFDDQHSYWRRNCEAKPLVKMPPKKTSTTTALQKRTPSELKRLKKKRQILEKRDVAYSATSDGTTPIAIGPGFAFFIMRDQNNQEYAVLIIQTFDVTDMDGWFNNMNKGFTTLMQKGIKRILIDLTGNSGGVLCLAYSLLSVLSPSPKYPFPATNGTYGTRLVPTDNLIKISQCVDEAGIKISPFKLQCFLDLRTRDEFPPGTTWASGDEVKPKVINGIISGYTKFGPFLMDKCLMKQSSLLANLKPGFTHIMVVTDGLCGSSCAIVATYLQQNKCAALLITADRGIGRNPNIYSFAGGQVLNVNNIKDIVKRSSCYDMFPKVLERNQLTVTYRAIFNYDDKKNPLEYYIMPAHSRFDYLDRYARSFAARWKDYFEEGLRVLDDLSSFTFDTTETGRIIPFSS